MTTANRVTQIERKVQRIERDLSKIRSTLRQIKPKSKRPKLGTLQKSIGRHLLSDQDPAIVIQQMRRRETR